MAMSNSLDLRPATAASPETFLGASDRSGGVGSSGRFGSGRFNGIHVDVGDHGDLIKETDLGGLSASLFTPTPGSTRGGLVGGGTHGGSPEGSFLVIGGGGRVSGNGSHLSSCSPTRLSTLMAAVNASNAAAAEAASSGGGSGGSTSRSKAPLSPQQHHMLEMPFHCLEELEHPEEEASVHHYAGAGLVLAGNKGGNDGGQGDAGHSSVYPHQRMIQSARPVTRSGQELDISVWQNNITAQVCMARA